jgi:hypothetical protein
MAVRFGGVVPLAQDVDVPLRATGREGGIGADRVPHIRHLAAARHQRRVPIDVAIPDPPGVLVTEIADTDEVTPNTARRAATASSSPLGSDLLAAC